MLCISIYFVLLTGCAMQYGDGLLSPPKLPGEYLLLQNKLDEVLAQGAVYAAAETGTNRQAVQLVDIDNDGQDEAIAFFRTVEGDYQIYVFRQTDNGYEQIGMAEGYGTSLRAVYYPTCADDGSQVLAVAWGFDESTTFGMTVFGFNDEGMYSMLDIQYAHITIEDIDEDAVDELIFISRDNATGNYCTRIYDLKNKHYRITHKVDLCVESRSVTNIQFGKTVGQVPALFIDSIATNGGYITDIINLGSRQAMNDTIDPASGSGSVTWRSVSVFSADIDGDGVIEIPVSRDTSPGAETQDSGDMNNKLYWCHMQEGQVTEEVTITFHNPQDAWYMLWPEQWGGDVSARRSVSVHMTKTAFYVPGGENNINIDTDQVDNVLLNICVFSGDNRAEYMQLYKNFKILKTTSKAIYCYSLPENSYQQYALTEEEVKTAFRLIESTWSTEVY